MRVGEGEGIRRVGGRSGQGGRDGEMSREGGATGDLDAGVKVDGIPGDMELCGRL